MRPNFKGLLAELTPDWLRRNGVPRQLRETPTIEASKKRAEPTIPRRQAAYRPPPPRIDDITHTL